MTTNHIIVEPISSHVGAVIRGVDLAAPSAGEVAAIRQVLYDHGVVFFRDQALTPDQHIAFAESFAPVDVNRFFAAVPTHPQIAEVRKEPGQKRNIGGGWHTDHSYDHAPAMGSVLVARETPPLGGDTLFASMAAAYAALSEGLKATLRGLRAVHSNRHTFGAAARQLQDGDMTGRLHNAHLATDDAVHPVVVRHPGSGRPVLYVNPGFTTHFEGWTPEESAPLLEMLYRHAARPEFQCRFQWQPGSVAFWDNRATWHYAANDYAGERRLMHRITVSGETLGAA
jgi:taurine dioxygenase